MRIPRAFLNERLSVGANLELPNAVHNYLVRVLRMKVGDQLYLFNGDGQDVLAELTLVDKRNSQVLLRSSVERLTESPLNIRIGQGISRGERMDWAIQKSVELGVQHICPLFSERSEVRLSADRQAKRTKHWQQVAISACEQSGRSTVPQIYEPDSLNQWIESSKADLKLVLHPSAQSIDLTTLKKPNSVALLVGPEGGLEQSEVDLALSHGFKSWLVGPRILRTETAPIAAATILNFLWGDLHASPDLGVKK